METSVLTTLATLMRTINGINRLVGKAFSWLALAIVLVCFAVVFERYVFANTRLWAQDLYVWLNGAMFTAVAAFALLRGDHVRVDIFYRPASARFKAIADLIGVLVFLLPFMIVVYIYSMPFVQRSWGLLENSANVGGMPGLYILKAFIIVFTVLVGLQGVAMMIRSILVLANRDDLVPADFSYQEQPSPLVKE
jgi:TRAP-type mannitol/chloroaromatic compound transport system permease small subunit